MRQEIIEALALELTKSKIASIDSRDTDKNNPALWVGVYLESEKQIKQSYKETLQPKEAVEINVIPISHNW